MHTGTEMDCVDKNTLPPTTSNGVSNPAYGSVVSTPQPGINQSHWGVNQPGAPVDQSAVSSDQSFQTSSSSQRTVRPAQSFSKKTMFEAYLLWLCVGLLGGHHFYLRRYSFGVVYFCTFGLLGIGWLVDLVRMYWLVKQANEKAENPWLRQQFSMVDAYVLWFPFGFFGYHLFYLQRPAQGILYITTGGFFGVGWLVDLFRIPYMVKSMNALPGPYEKDRHLVESGCLTFYLTGIAGCHHFYLKRPVWGILYTFTLGLAGFGWLYDWFRFVILTRRANAIKNGTLSSSKKFKDDIFILWFPLGILGFHHFYVHRYGWGFLYICTFGLFFLGWFADIFRIWSFVDEFNRQEEERERETRQPIPTCAQQTNVPAHPLSREVPEVGGATATSHLGPSPGLPATAPYHWLPGSGGERTDPGIVEQGLGGGFAEGEMPGLPTYEEAMTGSKQLPL
ncbi:uncharacterized protein LOC101864131 [Aplysia californica]|uniref:Uncharacterized protein LOC101864131 n=1 Tax=Aplysia californica TaxID=6500 RepID=A0ABM0ZW53_APLCA|nr:uncharacterized protein LOC101864131 [Aplysia californica]